MKIIGITGGVGAGKSRILDYIANNYPVEVIQADGVGQKLMEPGESCYRPVVETFGIRVLDDEGRIDRKKLAAVIFADPGYRLKINAIIHPAVKAYIRSEIEKTREENSAAAYFIEAALLIEDKYDEICDELWYIYADENIRRERLKTGRNYSDEKITGIMNSQLKEADFRKACAVTIDAGGDFEDTAEQIKHYYRTRIGD